jgi:hypothetical protein
VDPVRIYRVELIKVNFTPDVALNVKTARLSPVSDLVVPSRKTAEMDIAVKDCSERGGWLASDKAGVSFDTADDRTIAFTVVKFVEREPVPFTSIAELHVSMRDKSK